MSSSQLHELPEIPSDAARKRKDTTVKERFKKNFHAGTWFSFTKPKKRPRAKLESDMAFFGLMTKDTYERLLAIVGFCFEMFKVVMATLLAVFVPQMCPPTTSNPLPHTCTTEENFTDLTPFNKGCLAINFITLGFALMNYVLVYKREKWMIEYLDEDDNMPDTWLPKVIVRYPEIDAHLFRINTMVLFSSMTTIVLFIVNGIMSGVLVFRDYYESFRTATVFATNVALIGTVLEKTAWHSYAALQKRIALSCIDFDPRSFNVIDPDYRDPEAEKGLVTVFEDGTPAFYTPKDQPLFTPSSN